MPKVSVIIPVYRAEQYIERCARSLFEQTLDDIEYIFVDDCTPDSSIEILERELKDFPERISFVRIHRNERNLGAAGAKNAGMKLAKGEYLMFVDSDDYIDEDGVERMYSFAEDNCLDIAYSDYCGGYGRGIDDVVVEPDCHGAVECLRLLLLGRLQGFMPNKIFRREFLLKADEWLIDGANVYEDLGWCLRLFAHKPNVAHAPFSFYHYRYENPDSVLHSAIKNGRIAQDVLVNVTAAIKVIEQQGLAEELHDDLLYLKAQTKERFLTSRKSDLMKWRETFPEATEVNMKYPALRSIRIAKWFLVRGIYLPMLIRLNLWRIKELWN